MRKPDSCLGADAKLAQEEKMFVKGLVDVCPRCGMHRNEMNNEIKVTARGKIGPARQHLNNCNDKDKIYRYQMRLKRLAAQKAASQSKETAQEDAMIMNTWISNGRQVGQLWMLNAKLLKCQCDLFSLENSGTKVELIGRLAKHLRSKKPLLLTNNTSSQISVGDESGFDTSGISRVENEDLPSNLNVMDKEELMGVCASYGIKFNPQKDCKIDLVEKLEKARYKGNTEMTLMLEGKKRNGTLMLQDSTGQVSEDGGPPRRVSGSVRKRQEADEDFTIEDTVDID